MTQNTKDITFVTAIYSRQSLRALITKQIKAQWDISNTAADRLVRGS